MARHQEVTRQKAEAYHERCAKDIARKERLAALEQSIAARQQPAPRQIDNIYDAETDEEQESPPWETIYDADTEDESQAP